MNRIPVWEKKKIFISFHFHGKGLLPLLSYEEKDLNLFFLAYFLLVSGGLVQYIK